MTLTADRATDQTDPVAPTDQQPAPARAVPPWWRRRGVLGAGAGVLLVLLVVGLSLFTSGSSKGDDLDPRSAKPTGTLALAELLRQRGIPVSRGGTAPAGGTLVVPFAASLQPGELGRLLDDSGAAARVVLLAPTDVPGTGLTPTPAASSSSIVGVRPVDCDLPAARTAGSVRQGGRSFLGGTPACYGDSLVLTRRGSTQLVVVGSARFLANEFLDQDGNAALALGLFSGEGLPGNPSTSVVWYRPSLDPRASAPSILQLLPSSLLWAVLQLALAVVAVALWRGRRLGPVVEEPLPVVVPAAETVEGRARLYAAGKARAAAADALRTGARARLGNALEHGGEPDATGLVTAVAARSGRQPGEVALLLYGSAGPSASGPGAPPGPGAGPPGTRATPGTLAPGTLAPGSPADDAELVRLADDIDRLEAEVRAR